MGTLRCIYAACRPQLRMRVDAENTEETGETHFD